jgi:hypothetical protein
MSAPWAKVPKPFYEDRRLSDAAVRVGLALIGFRWQDGETEVGQRRLATSLGWSRAKTQRYLWELDEKGWIQTTHRVEGNSWQTNIYRFNFKKADLLAARRNSPRPQSRGHEDEAQLRNIEVSHARLPEHGSPPSANATGGGTFDPTASEPEGRAPYGGPPMRDAHAYSGPCLAEDGESCGCRGIDECKRRRSA